MSRLRYVARRLRHDESGQLLILVIGLAAIAALLVTLVTNLSRVFLQQRGLSAAADGAVVAAAQAVDESAVYGGATGETLPLDPAAVERAVTAYVEETDLAGRYDGLRVEAVGTDGSTVTVTLGADVRLPFVNLVSEEYADGYPISVSASARAPLTG